MARQARARRAWANWRSGLSLTDLNTAMAEAASKVDELLNALIPRIDAPENRLYDAMRYSAMAGGKRLRPFLVMQGAAMLNVAESCALRAPRRWR